jgi:hypothetical protein
VIEAWVRVEAEVERAEAATPIAPPICMAVVLTPLMSGAYS